MRWECTCARGRAPPLRPQARRRPGSSGSSTWPQRCGANGRHCWRPAVPRANNCGTQPRSAPRPWSNGWRRWRPTGRRSVGQRRRRARPRRPQRPVPRSSAQHRYRGKRQHLAWRPPLIVQWRQARAVRAGAADRLTALRAEERRRELELVLIGAYHLTRPPAMYPWDALTRRNEVDWRRRTLARVRGERRWAQWRRRRRRVLTLGWW